MAAIPPALESAILEKAASGASTRDVSQWLAGAHGVKASYKAVQRLLSRTRSERADVAKVIVREKLAKTLTTDLDVLSAELERARRLSERLHALAHKALDAFDSPDDASPEALRVAIAGAGTFTDLALKATAQVNGVAKTRLHFSGADAPDDTLDELSQAEQRLAGRLDSLASRLGAGEGAERDRADAAGEGGS